MKNYLKNILLSITWKNKTPFKTSKEFKHQIPMLFLNQNQN